MGNTNPRCNWSACDCPERQGGGTVCKFEEPDEYMRLIGLRNAPAQQTMTAPLVERFSNTAQAKLPTELLPKLTDQEIKIVTALGAVWNDYLELNEGPADKEEFMNNLHALQRQVMARLARRVHPNLFQNRWR